MYNLATDGINALFQRRPSTKRLIRREPLVGNIDGKNTVFLTSQRPFILSTLKVYEVDDPEVLITPTTIDPDGGELVVAFPPSTALQANYTLVPFTHEQAIFYAWSGFALMQTLWTRPFALSSDAALYVQAQPTDPNIYIVSVGVGGVCSDPTFPTLIGQMAFSESTAQRNLLALCIDMAYLDTQILDSASGDIEIHERMGGVAINPTKRAANLLAAKESCWGELEIGLAAAQDEDTSAGSEVLQGSIMPRTDDYLNRLQWQNKNTVNGIVS